VNRVKLRHAPAATRRVADRLIAHCQAIGLYANRTQSHVSASQYVHVGATDAAKEVPTKIRVSDHERPVGAVVDYGVVISPQGAADLRPAVRWLAKRYRVDADAHLQRMDVRARHAAKAAATRARRRAV
jgi:hypothetical protein